MFLSKGSKGEAVKALQQVLNVLHYQGKKSESASSDYKVIADDGIFGPDTEDAVIQFQEDYGLYTDGQVGPVTRAALDHEFSTRQIELTSPKPAPSTSHLEIVKGPADAFDEGYSRVRLRSDVMEAYKKVYDKVHASGALLTSSGGIRDLNAKVGANRSATSFHYSGRALDLYIWSGMKDPKTDPYVVQRLGDRRYRVFARCKKENSQSDYFPNIVQVDDIITYKSRVKGVSLKDHFIDLTGLFMENGFQPIRARKGFEPGTSGPLGAEWWHFQWEVGLIPEVTTFGSELKKLYSEAELKPTPPWKYRDYVWKVDWF